MPRPIAGSSKMTARLHIVVEPQELEEIDDIQFSNRIRTRSETIRRLMKLGIQAVREGRALD